MRTEDYELAKDAVFMDDIDMFLSPEDGALVVVAMKSGRRVCQGCGLGFEATGKLKGVEVKFEHARMFLHPGCVDPKKKKMWIFHNLVKGMQVRRTLAKTARESQSLVGISAQNANRIV